MRVVKKKNLEPEVDIFKDITSYSISRSAKLPEGRMTVEFIGDSTINYIWGKISNHTNYVESPVEIRYPNIYDIRLQYEEGN